MESLRKTITALEQEKKSLVSIGFDEKHFDLANLKAIKGDDDALSGRESVIEGRLSATANQLNKSLETAESFLGKSPTRQGSWNMNVKCCEESRIEVEKLKEEINGLRKDNMQYEEIVASLSKKLQGGVRERCEKGSVEEELGLYKQKVIDNEKSLGELRRIIQENESQMGFSKQDYELKVKALGESQKKVSETIKKQIELEKERQRLSLLLQEAQHNIKSALQKEETLEMEVKRLSSVIEEQRSMIKTFEKENERLHTFSDDVNFNTKETEQLQEQIRELNETINKRNAEIDVWKDEYEKLDTRTKKHKREGSDLTIDVKVKLDHVEKKMSDLIRENNNLNELLKMRLQESEDLKKSYDMKLKTYREEMCQKWLRSYSQMEEIALNLESKKDNMQAQLERMRAIVEANSDELEELYEENEKKTQENLELLEEVKNLKEQMTKRNFISQELEANNAQYHRLWSDFNEQKKMIELYKNQIECLNSQLKNAGK